MTTILTSTTSTTGYVLTPDTTGTLVVKTGSGVGTTALTIDASQNTTFAGTVTSPTGALYPLSSGTAVAATSGAAIDFTGIPATAKRVTVMFNGVSTSGTANLLIQLGISTGIDSLTYSAASIRLTGTTSNANYTTGFGINNNNASASISGQMTITNMGSNIWVSSHALGDPGSGNNGFTGGGTKTLSGVLDRVRITTNGADTFDAGSVNILWE